MKRPGRLRRVVFWSGVLACLLVGTTWLVAIRWQIWYAWRAEIIMYYDTRLCGLADGGVIYQAFHPSSWDEYRIGARGWHSESGSGDFGFQKPRITTRWFRTNVWIPLWLVMLAVAIPTLAAWLWRHRRVPGTCAICGYNLTGNVSGRCPECGTAIEREGKSA